MKALKIILIILGVLFALAIVVTLLLDLFPDRYAIVNFLIYCGAAAFLFMVSRVLMYLCRVYADREEHYIRYRIFSALWIVLVTVSFPVSIPLLCIEDKFEQYRCSNLSSIQRSGMETGKETVTRTIQSAENIL